MSETALPVRRSPRTGRRIAAAAGIALGGVLVAGAPCNAARSQELVVPPGQVAILMRLVGRPLPAGEWIAPAVGDGEEPWQGILEDVLPPGRHADVTSDDWSWEIVPQTSIGPDQIGVLVRLFGAELSPGRVLADEDPADAEAGIRRRGILGRTLEPGTHLINTRAYEAHVFPRVALDAGEVGVLTRLVGPATARPESWLAADGERGTQAQALPPGSHSVNPYVAQVTPFSRQSRRLDMAAANVRVRFPTADGFEIQLQGAVEWSVPDDAAPAVFVAFGPPAAVQETLILPATRAISRLHGSKSPARDFIVGSSRQTFQDEFARDLMQLVEAEGPQVHSVGLSGVRSPPELAQLIQERVQAQLLREQLEVEFEKWRSCVELVRQKELEARPELLAQTEAFNAERLGKARQEQAVIEAAIGQALTVADLDLEAARLDARRHADRARAEAAAIRDRATNDASVLAERARAHGGGLALARTMLLERLATRLIGIEDEADGAFARTLFGLALGPAAAADPAAPAAADAQEERPGGGG